MKKHFANYNQSLALKELGFDEPCLAFYQKEYTEETPVMIDDDYQYRLTGWRTCRNSEIPKHYTSAPLKSQVFEWFRENHNLRSNIMDFIDDVTGIEWDYEIATIGTDLDENGNYIPLVDYSIDDEIRKFKTYEEAESACIDKLIELLQHDK